MKYRRALFLVDPKKPVAPSIDILRRVAPELEHVLAIAPVTDRYGAPGPPLDALREAMTGAAPDIAFELAPELKGEAVAALAAQEKIDLLVFGSRSIKSASMVSVQRMRPPMAVLWAEGPASPDPIKVIGCVALDRGSRAAIAAFLRDHSDPSAHVALFSPTVLPPDVVRNIVRVAGIDADVEVSSPGAASSLRQWLEEWTRERRIDLLVFARVPAAVVLGALWTAPVLLVPALSAPRPFGQRAIDVADLIDDGSAIRVRVGQGAAVGDLAAIPDQPVAFVSKGGIVATSATSAGEAELPAGLGLLSVGVYRVGSGTLDDPLAAIEERVSVIRAGDGPLVLFDSELPNDTLRALRASNQVSLAVRLRPTKSCRSIRDRLRALGLTPLVIDARAVLDEGEALDVSDMLDAVRLARVAAKLKNGGFPISAIVHQGPVPPLPRGFAVQSGANLEGVTGDVTPAALSQGNRVELEIDNATARRWLLDAIASSTQTLNFQVYMAADDDVGRAVEAALVAAARRGVTVRVLVDSLHGLYGSFATHNPLLERLAALPGIELRAVRPIASLPSLQDLKQRDHKKLVVADGRVALVGGRNLSHEYYTPFEEVSLTSESLWREVPWLDAGARIEGPAVEPLAASFLEAWTEAGGTPFELVSPARVGTCAARVVVHRGLRDASTLETYLELIERARSHLYIVHGFPLMLEIQHALLRAIRRGVRVRSLLGHLTPSHGGQPFKGPWSTARTAATELVHSRMDPVIAAGGEAYLYALRDLPGWAPGLGVVHPHVHAKVMTSDGLRCALGSANMDITGSYWESELLLVVEDAALTRELEARIDELMDGSTQVKPDDPAWREHAQRRAWMRRWPGVLSA